MAADPLSSPGSRDDDERRHRRGLKFRKGEDHAVELFREARAHLADRDRVNRILLELGKFYNPYIHAPIVDLSTRRRIVELLDRSATDEAAQLLDARLDLYTRGDEGEEG